MKKKLFGMISVLVVAALLAVGCKEPEKETVVMHDIVDPEPDSEQAVYPGGSTSDERIEEGDSALVALEVTEDFAKTNGCLCLYRKGKLYSLGPYVSSQAMYDYYIGHRETDDRAKLVEKMGSDISEIITMGDTPEICLKEGDELRDYSGAADPLCLIDYEGYTIKAWRSGSPMLIPYINKPTVSPKGEITVLDQSGNAVEWPSILPYMGIYTVEWYEGVDYHSCEMQADSKKYSNARDPVGLSKEPTKDGYELIDWAALSSGTYYSKTLGTLPMIVR